MKDIQLLIKKNVELDRYESIYPNTFTSAVKDRNSGLTLTEILSNFNMYFLSYVGSKEATRIEVPKDLRRTGLWVTYVNYEKIITTEWYAGEDIDDENWLKSSNWRLGSNMLVGDITISSEGNWIINGTDSGIKALGERGITPRLLVKDNKLEVSYTNGTSWLTISDYIGALFRFKSDTNSDTIGVFLISRDDGKTWSDISAPFTNNLKIKGYVTNTSQLPTDAVQGDIYGVGPTYDPSDTSKTNPIYTLYVRNIKDNVGSWVNNGKFTSISAGVVLELGSSKTEVMSQNEVTTLISNILNNTFGHHVFIETTKNIQYNKPNLFLNVNIKEGDYYSITINSETIKNSTFGIYENNLLIPGSIFMAKNGIIRQASKDIVKIGLLSNSDSMIETGIGEVILELKNSLNHRLSSIENFYKNPILPSLGGDLLFIRSSDIIIERSNITTTDCTITLTIPNLILSTFTKKYISSLTVVFDNVVNEFGCIYSIYNKNLDRFTGFTYGEIADPTISNKVVLDNNTIKIPIIIWENDNIIYKIPFLKQINDTINKLNKLYSGILKTLSIEFETGIPKTIRDWFKSLSIRKGEKFSITYIRKNGLQFKVPLGVYYNNKVLGFLPSEGTYEFIALEPVNTIGFGMAIGLDVISGGTLEWTIDIAPVNNNYPNTSKVDSLIVVDSKGNGDYISLREAIDNAKDSSTNPVTIMILPGTYSMPTYINYTKSSNRYISIIGTDKNNCILKNTGGNYANSNLDDACIKIAGNIYIANLTIISTDEDYIQEGNNRRMSYCIHLDSSTPQNTICEIYNCILYNNHFSCIGIGLRSNYTIKITDCELLTTLSSEHSSNWGTIFCHDGQSSFGLLKIQIKNCNISNTNGTNGIQISDSYKGIITMEYTNNVIDSIGVGAVFPNSAIKTKFCFGNNIPILNY